MIKREFYTVMIYRSLFHFTFLLIFLSSSLTFADPVRFSSDQQHIIGVRKSFSPFEYRNSKGFPDGYTVDLMKAIAKKEGLNITFKLDTSSNVLRDLKDKEIDAVTAMIYSKERDELFDFSIPYLVLSYSLFKRSETPLRSVDHVKNKEIIVVDGVYAHEWLIKNKYTDSIIAVNTPAEAMRLLASGKHDFVVMSRLHGLDLLDDLNINNVEAAGPPVLAHEISFAVAEGNTTLLAELNEGIFLLQQSGEYDEIYLKWFSVNKYTKHMRTVTKYVLLVFSVIIFILLTVLFWNWLLKRAVRRKTAELYQNEERLNLIVQGIPIPTFVVDENRIVTHWNKACEFLTGETADNIVGTKNYSKALYDKKTYSIVDLLLDNILMKRVQQHDSETYRASSLLEGSYETEMYFPHLGIDGKWLYGAGVLLKDETGKTIGAIETWQDLTEVKQLGRQLIQSQKMEAIGTLAGGIAHDFNNILTAVNGYAEMALLNLPKESAVSDMLEQILSAGMRAKNLVNQILTFSRHAEIKTERIQVSLIVEETVKLFQSSLPPDITVIQDIQSDALVSADATHIHQVIMNLLTNASHAMSDNGGVLGVRLFEVQINEYDVGLKANLIPGRFVTLTVSDTGQGIPLEIQNKILDPFFTTKSRGEGTGMGLSVTHGIVKQYGGVIDFDSELGKGSTFQVYLQIVTNDGSSAASRK